MILRIAILAVAIALLLGSSSAPAEEPIPDYAEERGRIPLAILDAYDFQGDIVVHDPRSGGTYYPRVERRHDRAWPWASVTKQVLAVLVLQEVERGRIELESAASTYLPALAGEHGPTVRQLLQHRSGLRNPDDTPLDESGFPDFYSTGPTGIDWCLAERAPPSDEWRYNNCDYIVLGALLEAVTGEPVESLLRTRVGEAAGWTRTRLFGPGEAPGFVGQDAEYERRIGRYGSSAALVGPLEDMLRFDRALLAGELLDEEAMGALWQADPALGYMALGQWVFEAPLEYCDVPVRIVERRGAIGRYQVRNIILPDLGVSLAMATEQGDFEFGEIWTGSGFMFQLLSAVACG